jgi:ABC-2 type transport system permease protein
MQGLMKNNHYKIIATFKLLFLFIVITGIAIVVFGKRNTSFLTAFSYLSTIGFSLSTAIGLRKNNTGKWKQYMLTLPVKRSDIIKSVYLTQGIVLIAGIIVAGIVFSTSFLIHGFSYYRHIDILLIFSSSIGISLFMSAVFFPCSYADNKDRAEVIGIISLLIGAGIVLGLITILNIVFEKPNDIQLILMGIGSIILSFAAYLLSYIFTAVTFLRKEF